MKAILIIPISLNRYSALVREKINRGGVVYEFEGQIICLNDKAYYSLPIA